MPGVVSAARFISMPRSSYVGIFRKIVGALIHSPKILKKNILTPTNQGVEPRYCACRCVWVSESFRLVCFLALFAEHLRSKITFKIFGVDFNPEVSMPGGVSSARLNSMSRSGYMEIFRKIVVAHSFTKNL